MLMPTVGVAMLMSTVGVAMLMPTTVIIVVVLLAWLVSQILFNLREIQKNVL